MTSITPTPPPLTTTPSGLIVPRPPAGAGAAEQTTPSGLVVVRHRLSPVVAGTGLVVPDRPIGGDGALAAAKAAHAELASSQGAPAADIVLGAEVELAQRVRNDEIRTQAIAAFLAGDVQRAAELISRAS